MESGSHDDDRTQGVTIVQPGTQIAHYDVVEKIGEGGMGEVYLANDTRLNRKVALKFLPTHFLADKSAKARFVREAQSAAGLDHPNIITIYEVSEFNGRPFFAMQYLEGDSLKDLITRAEMPVEKILDVAIQITSGLKHAHEKGVIHRDIKPGNISVDKTGRAVILDFGLAAVESEEALTQAGTTLGTIGYMAPEQIQGKEVDGRSDIFSMGVVLFEMLARTAPFKRDSQASTINAVLNEHPGPLSNYRENVEQGFEEVVSRALDKDVETRYQSASGMLADLKRLKKILDPESSTKTFVSVGSRKSDSGKRRFAITGGLLSIAVVVALLLIFLASDGTFFGNGVGPMGTGTATAGQWASSIAVLPFMDFSSEQNQEYFCDGMTDAIISKLTGIDELKVISMTSVMRYKSEDRDLEKIGEDLDVGAVLDGSVQKEGDNIRVSARLVDVENGQQLWSRQFDRKLESVFAIQDEISRNIVDVLKLELLGTEQKTLTQRHTDNIDAYNLYVQGRFFWRKRTDEALRTAIDYFERAIELDSNYALAYAGLADAWAVLPGYSTSPEDSATVMAEKAATRAVELNSSIAEAHASLGLTLMNLGNLQEARESLERAIDLNPGYSWAHTWYSNVLGQLGMKEESLKELEIAYELDPLSIVNLMNLASDRSEQGRVERAIELLERALEIEENVKIYAMYATVLSRAGRPDEAIDQYEKAIALFPEMTSAWNSLAYMCGENVSYDSGLVVFDRCLEANPGNAEVYTDKGWYQSRYGDLEGARQSAQKALSIDPSRQKAGQLLFTAAMYQQEWDVAGSLLERFKEFIPPSEVMAHAELEKARAVLYAYQGRLEDAIALVEREFEYDSESDYNREVAARKTMAAGFYVAFEKYEEALSAIRQATRYSEKVFGKQSRCDNNYNRYARLLALNGEIARATEIGAEYSECWVAQDTIFEVLSDRIQAHIYYADGEYDTAGDFYLEVIDAMKRNRKSVMDFTLRYNCALALNNAERFRETIEVLSPVIDNYAENERFSDPTACVHSYYVLGVAYAETSQIEPAIEHIETFLSFWGNGDPGLRGVEDARDRLKRLRSQT